MLQHEKCVAVGEIGLDRNYPNLGLQKVVMEAQLKMAIDFKLPVVIHCVKALSDIFSILNNYPSSLKVYLHGINLNSEQIVQVRSRNYYIGIGALAFKNSKIMNFAHLLPKDKVLIETDDTGYSVQEVFNKLYDSLREEPESFKNQLNTNFRSFFQLFYKK
jgi:TatD DNase family protein